MKIMLKSVIAATITLGVMAAVAINSSKKTKVYLNRKLDMSLNSISS